MAKLLKKFDTKGKKGMDDRSVIPGGTECLFTIKKSDYVETKKKDGHLATFALTVVEGDYKGKMVFVNLNLDNPDDQTVEIAEKEMTSLTHACGLRAVESTEELHGIPFMGKVGVVEAKGTFPEKNKIVKYWAVEKSKAGKTKKPKKDKGDKEESEEKSSKKDKKEKKPKKPDVTFGDSGKKDKKDKKKKDKKKDK